MTSTEPTLPFSTATLPRVLPGAVMSARAWTIVDQHAKALGSTFTVFRTRSAESPPGPVTISPNVDYTIGWNTSSDPASRAFSPVYPGNVTVLLGGTYLLQLQVRYAAVGPTGMSGSAVGLRYARIMLNGTAAPTDTIIDAQPRPGSTIGDGTTVTAFGAWSLRAGDQIYGAMRHSADRVIPTANTDAGGTFLALTYLGPGGSQ